MGKNEDNVPNYSIILLTHIKPEEENLKARMFSHISVKPS